MRRIFLCVNILLLATNNSDFHRHLISKVKKGKKDHPEQSLRVLIYLAEINDEVISLKSKPINSNEPLPLEIGGSDRGISAPILHTIKELRCLSLQF